MSPGIEWNSKPSGFPVALTRFQPRDEPVGDRLAQRAIASGPVHADPIPLAEVLDRDRCIHRLESDSQEAREKCEYSERRTTRSDDVREVALDPAEVEATDQEQEDAHRSETAREYPSIGPPSIAWRKFAIRP